MTSAVSQTTLTHLFDAFCANDAPLHGRLLARTVRAGRLGLVEAIRGHVLGDDWLDFAQASLDAVWARHSGHLYVVANPVTPQFLKVGKTRLAPERRVRSLNNEAVIGEYLCVQHWAVHDRHFLESAAHRALADLPRHKEHFACHWRELCPRVDAVIAEDRARFREQGFATPTFQPPAR